jgi:hypothetical protein
MVEAYFRKGKKIDGNWEYSVNECFEEVHVQILIGAIKEMSSGSN